MGWNYRVFRRDYKEPADKWTGSMYGIHECYYDENDKPNGWSENAESVDSEQPDGIAWMIMKFAEAMTRPVLDYADGSEISPLPAAEYLASITPVEE